MFLIHLHSSTRLLVSYSRSLPRSSSKGKYSRQFIHICLRRQHGPFQEPATSNPWLNLTKGAVSLPFSSIQYALNSQTTNISTTSCLLPPINPASRGDASCASIAPIPSRDASTMASLKPLEEHKNTNEKGTSKKRREFKLLSEFTYFPKAPKSSLSPSLPNLSHSERLKFSPPTAKMSDPPDPVPYLDFRKNDSRVVYYTKDAAQANIWLKSIESCATRMWALDAEWKPYDFSAGKQGKIALIQLGNDKTVFLFHVFHMEKFPSVLAKILQDRNVLKVGINIRNDGTKIMKDWGVGCASLVELGVISTQVQGNLENMRKIRSMDTLARELLGHAVEKTASIQMGNWQNKNLSTSLLAYAANDVYVTYEVAKRIKYLQKFRPLQNYTLELTTILKDQAEVVNVHGTLQQIEDNTSLTRDNVIHATRQSRVAPKPSPTPTASIQDTPGKNTRDNVELKSPEKPITNSKPRQETARDDLIGGIFFGGRSTITIIPANKLKRAYSTRNSGSVKDSTLPADKVVITTNMLPESMDTMDISERNQTIWLRAGGRDLSEDLDLPITENDDDWYLKQNQALFQSFWSEEDSDKKET